MDFTFTNEQELLSETVHRFVREQYPFEVRRNLLSQKHIESVWAELAGLGLTAINIAEEHGGLEAGPVETMLVMNALGQGLLIEPCLEAAVLAPALLANVGDSALELLPAVAAGERILILAHEEPHARGTLS